MPVAKTDLFKDFWSALPPPPSCVLFKRSSCEKQIEMHSGVQSVQKYLCIKTITKLLQSKGVHAAKFKKSYPTIQLDIHWPLIWVSKLFLRQASQLTNSCCSRLLLLLAGVTLKRNMSTTKVCSMSGCGADIPASFHGIQKVR